MFETIQLSIYRQVSKDLYDKFYERATSKNALFVDQAFLALHEEIAEGNIDNKFLSTLISSPSLIDALIEVKTSAFLQDEKNDFIDRVEKLDGKVDAFSEAARESNKKILINIGIPVVFPLAVIASITANKLMPYVDKVEDAASNWFNHHFAIQDTRPLEPSAVKNAQRYKLAQAPQ